MMPLVGLDGKTYPRERAHGQARVELLRIVHDLRDSGLTISAIQTELMQVHGIRRSQGAISGYIKEQPFKPVQVAQVNHLNAPDVWVQQGDDGCWFVAIGGHTLANYEPSEDGDAPFTPAVLFWGAEVLAAAEKAFTLNEEAAA